MVINFSHAKKNYLRAKFNRKNSPQPRKIIFRGGPRKKNYLRRVGTAPRGKKNIYGPPGSARAKKIIYSRVSAKKFFEPFFTFGAVPLREKKIIYDLFWVKKCGLREKKLFTARQPGSCEKKIIYGLPVRCPRKNNYLWPAGQAHSEKKLFTSNLESAENPKIIFRGEL